MARTDNGSEPLRDEELPEVSLALADVETDPESEFWRNYSPHFEMPIGWVLGFLVVALMFAAVVLIVQYGDRETDKTGVPIVIDPDGGDDDGGDGKLGGGGEENPKVLADFATPTTKEDIAAALPENVQLPEVKDKLTKQVEADDPTADVTFSDEKAASYGGLADDIQKKLLGVGGKKGSGGGPGSGDGPNQDGNGGKGANSSRARSLRWVLQFRTFNGRDYLEQLAAIGAEIAIPIPPENKKFLLFRNLRAPGKGEEVTEDKLVRLSGQMQFADIKRESVASVAAALGLDYTPHSFWAFFPRGAEDELAKLEKAYNNLQPEAIAVTKFKVEVVNGKHQFIVSEQTRR